MGVVGVQPGWTFSTTVYMPGSRPWKSVRAVDTVDGVGDLAGDQVPLASKRSTVQPFKPG